MNRKAFIIMVAIEGACTAGPDQPKDYRGPAAILNARFFDVPAEKTVAAEVDINAVDLCAPREYQQPNLKEVPVDEDEVSPFVAENVQIEVLGTVDNPSLPVCGSDPRELRFFRVHSTFWVSSSAIGPSTSPIAHELVYAPSATTFSPFGPSGPTVDFPQGYSWLRRTCGAAPDLIEMAVVSTDEIVDFHSDGLSRGIDQSEQALVEGCGATVPAVALGSRVSFDHAQALVWSADGASIYYLAPADSQDPTQSVSLRQLRLADGATSEVIVIPFGRGLQGDSTGQLYVGNWDNLLRVDTSSSPASLVSIPVRSDAVVSPDGRWLAHVASTPVGNEVRIWDIQSGADLTSVDGSFLGWSPDSRLAYRSPYTASSTFSVLSPAAPGQPRTYGTWGNSSLDVVWSTEGPLLAQRPFAWSIQSDIHIPPACGACFGLSLQDPVTGAARPVLDASAGMIDIVPTPPVLGFMLVWARTCLGLYNTVCSYSLNRVDLADGTAREVAVSRNVTVSATEIPVAVSHDYQHVAIAAPGGIYVKSLAP